MAKSSDTSGGHSSLALGAAPVSKRITPTFGCSIAAAMMATLRLGEAGLGLERVLTPAPARAKPSSYSMVPRSNRCSLICRSLPLWPRSSEPWLGHVASRTPAGWPPDPGHCPPRPGPTQPLWTVGGTRDQRARGPLAVAGYSERCPDGQRQVPPGWRQTMEDGGVRVVEGIAPLLDR